MQTYNIYALHQYNLFLWHVPFKNSSFNIRQWNQPQVVWSVWSGSGQVTIFGDFSHMPLMWQEMFVM